MVSTDAAAPTSAGPRHHVPRRPPPDRARAVVDAHGVGIAIYEWGEEGPPLFLRPRRLRLRPHVRPLGAARLAAGGWRVVSWDQRGHGDSDHAALYSWDADLRDALAVMDARHRPSRRRSSATRRAAAS